MKGCEVCFQRCFHKRRRWRIGRSLIVHSQQKAYKAEYVMERGSAVNSTQYQARLPCPTTIGGWFFTPRAVVWEFLGGEVHSRLHFSIVY